MKMLTLRLSVLLLACALFGAVDAVSAQTPDQYIISAKAGMVNLVAGPVMMTPQGVTQWRTLMNRDSLEAGDVVRTASGRMEMLLNPGSYMRVAEQSEFELTNPSFDTLQIKLISGSAIFEMTGTNGTELAIEVTTPQKRFVIARNGLYRVNVLPNGTSELVVRKGKVNYGDDLASALKDKKKLIASSDTPTPVISNLDKKDQDAFDLWSEQRALALAEANTRFSNTTVASAINAFQSSGAPGFGYSPYFGLWMFDPSMRCYAFFPFYDGWYSPYGYPYWNGYGLPWWYYRPLPPTYSPTPTGGGIATNRPTKTPINTINDRTPSTKSPVAVTNLPNPTVHRPQPKPFPTPEQGRVLANPDRSLFGNSGYGYSGNNDRSGRTHHQDSPVFTATPAPQPSGGGSGKHHQE